MPKPFISSNVTQAASPRIAAHTGKPKRVVLRHGKSPPSRLHPTTWEALAPPRAPSHRRRPRNCDGRSLPSARRCAGPSRRPSSASVYFADLPHSCWRESSPSGPAITSKSSALSATFRGHRAGGVDGHLQRSDAGVGHEPERRLQPDDAAIAGGNSDRSGLVRRRSPSARRPRQPAPRYPTTSRRWCDRAFAGSAPGRSNWMAAAGHAIVLAHRLAGDFAAFVEDARDDGGVHVRHRAVEEARADHHRHAGEADVVLQRHPPPGELATGLALDRSFEIPGAERIFLRRRPPSAVARVFHRRLLVGKAVRAPHKPRPAERRCPARSAGRAPAGVHAELLCGVAQIGDRRFLKHD